MYKWIDEKGEVHVTDDPNKVPERFRSANIPPPLVLGRRALWMRSQGSLGTESGDSWKRQGTFKSIEECERAKRGTMSDVRMKYLGTRVVESVTDGFEIKDRSGAFRITLGCFDVTFDPR